MNAAVSNRKTIKVTTVLVYGVAKLHATVHMNVKTLVFFLPILCFIYLFFKHKKKGTKNHYLNFLKVNEVYIQKSDKHTPFYYISIKY